MGRIYEKFYERMRSKEIVNEKLSESLEFRLSND